MGYRRIEVPFKKLQTIHHLADIHIRNLKRHKENFNILQNLLYIIFLSIYLLNFITNTHGKSI